MAKRCPYMDSKAIVDHCLDKVHDKIRAMLPSQNDLRRTVKHIQKAINGESPPVSPKNLKDLGEIPEEFAKLGEFWKAKNLENLKKT